MIQSIVAAAIVLIAFIFVLLPLFTKKKPDNSCNTCASAGCGGCPISEAARDKEAANTVAKRAK